VEDNSKDHPYVLSVDLGTSGAKTALVSIFGHVAGFEYEPVPLHLMENGGAEQDPDDWWQGILQSSKRLLARNLVPVEQVVAINCSTQWVGTVPVDKNGKHLMNAVIWMDSRGAAYVRKQVSGLINVAGYDLFKLMRWVRLTGGAPPLSGKDPSGHIPFIRNELPEVYRQTDTFLEPKDYINLRLTGRQVASADSITCHWVTDNRDIHNIRYDQKLLNMGGIDRSKLPDLVPANHILGPVLPAVAQTLGLPEGVPVISGSPDIMAAAVGSGAIKDYETHLYIGTSSWVSAHVAFKKTDILHGIASLPSAIPGRYLICDEQETAGASLTFLKENILYARDGYQKEESVPVGYDVFDRLAAQTPPGSNRLLFTPWLNGERTPVEDNNLRACLFNMSLQTTRADMVRAVFEGVALNHRWSLSYVEKFMKRKTAAIHMVGGGAKSDIWCQIHADILNRTIRQVKDPIQSNVRGSAFLAAVALGYLSYEDIPQHIRFKDTYEPNPKHRECYDKRFQTYLQFYRHNRKIFKRLNT
jgi:xylulokinase